MKTLPTLSSALGLAFILASCALPQKHSALMHGKVRGGDVPLYVMGGVSDFASAGLLDLSSHDYYRTEYEVLDMSASGVLTPSLTFKTEPVAQLAVPTLVSTVMLPSGYEARYALAPSDKLGGPSSLIQNLTQTIPASSLTPGWSVRGDKL
jgi:hypothetical protein